MRLHALRTAFRFTLLIIIAGIVTGIAVFLSVIKDLPDPTKLSEKPISQSTKIFDRTGKIILYEIHGEEKRTVIPFLEMTKIIKDATIAAEDANFYSHGGLDIRGIIRALYIDIKTKDIRQGGSTITQQLIKNTLIGREQTLKRKVKEAILALLLESKYSKDEILELYLNQIPYGSNAYGIEAAAQTFFGKQAKNLSLAEAALLAALPKAPSYYSPHGAHKLELLSSKDAILERMLKLGMIFEKDLDLAKKEKLVFQPPHTNIKAPHFVMFVRDYLEDHYDTRTIENGGLKITTTLDWDLQQKAEKIITDGSERNKELGAKNAALVALDPKTGSILAMVGSRDYFDITNDGNVNVTTRPRQPGSAFKPIAYVTALQKGFTPKTIIFDVPTEFNVNCTPDLKPASEGIEEKDCYHPQNYDGQFRGPVSFRQALQQSLNVPSVKVLYLAGIEDTIQTAESLGITTLKDRKRFGLSLVLGGGEVKLIELVSAYGTFSQDGILNPPTAILKIEDAKNSILEEYKQTSFQILDPEATRQLNSILIDNEARVPVFIRNSSLYFADREVAAKTGTTQENRDAWIVGYTPSLVSGVWVGNNDNTAMKENTAGVLAAAPMWHQFMQEALGTTTSEHFAPPAQKEVSKTILRGFWQGGTIVKIDKISKKEATPLTPPEFIEEISVGGEPHSILYWTKKDDPEGPSPENPSSDSQFTNWETAVQRWLQDTGYKKPQSSLRTGVDDIHTEKNKPSIAIRGLSTTNILPRESNDLMADVKTNFPVQEISVRFDAIFLSILKQSPQVYVIILPSGIEEGFHTLSISVSDIYGNRTVLEKEIIAQ